MTSESQLVPTASWGRASLALAVLQFLAQLAVFVGFFAYQRWLVSHDERAIGAIAGGISWNWSWIYLALTILGIALGVVGLVRGERPWYPAVAGIVANLVAPLAGFLVIVIVAKALHGFQ